MEDKEQKEHDPLDGLEERLQSHAKAFESLLALTPAREHYGSQIDDGLDPSEQWNRKKQTKEQKKAAKKAKLDPANQKSALDVVREREKKRKRELGIEDEDANEKEETAESAKPNKKQKKELTAEEEEAKRQAYVAKRKEKREKNREKKQRKVEKAESKRAAKQNRDLADVHAGQQAEAGAEPGEDDDSDAEPAEIDAVELGKVDFSGLAGADDDEGDDNQEEGEDDASSVPSSPEVDSPAFDVATNHSEASSSSSIVPPSTAIKPGKVTKSQPTTAKPDLKLDLSEQSKPGQKPLPSSSDIPSGTSSPKLQLPNIDQAQLQERLRARIEALRAQRKADDGEGKPARSRQELLEQRRKKEEQRKAHKKELRRQAKEEEARKREEQLRGSGSPLSTDILSRASPRPADNTFSFSKLAFEDGTAADASLTGLREAKKRKGPQDPKTALLAAEKKQARINSFDEEKKKDIAEKDMWLNAKKRAHGERIRDDTSLLKKALKRKEKQKGKSEQEWKERQDAVVKGKEIKQKKRDANLQKRREEKGNKGGKKKSPGGKGASKKKRPGFEGRFKA